MFHISQRKSRSRTVVVIDGRLAGDYVGVTETCCQQALSSGKPVHVLLREVSDIDQAGRDLLSRLVVSGVRLHATGVYTSYIVEELWRVVTATMQSPVSHGEHLGIGYPGCSEPSGDVKKR